MAAQSKNAGSAANIGPIGTKNRQGQARRHVIDGTGSVRVTSRGECPDSARWWALAVISIAVILSLTTWFSTTAITSELKSAWTLSDAELGWMTNAVQIGFVSGALLASLFNIPDLFRLNRLMAMAAALAGMANAALLLQPGVVGAICLRLLTGMALACIYPPAMKLVATWFVRDRGLALGIVVGALSLGSAMPHLFRAVGAAFSWQGVVVSTSLAAFLSALILLLWAHDGPYRFSRAIFDPRQIGMVFRDRNLLLVNIGYFGHMWELYAMWTWLLTFLGAALAGEGLHDPRYASILTFAAIAAGVPGCILAGRMGDRIGRTLTTSIFMIASGGCALLVGALYGGPIWLLFVIVLVWGVTIIGDSAQFSAALTEFADPSFVGTALSVQMGLGFGLTVLAIWLMPQLAGHFGSWQWVFVILAPGPLIGAGAMLALRRRPDASRLANGRR